MFNAFAAASIAAVLIAGAGVSHAQTAPPPVLTPDYPPPTLRLPTGPRPTRYELALSVVPGEAKATGEIVIDVELDKAYPVLWLNADEVTVSRASVNADATDVTVLPDNPQFVGLVFKPALPAGRHRLRLAFESEQARNSTRGIFALQDSGDWYAMTQFEATSARRAFPCFDEPGFKVPWRLTLHVPRQLVAVSNTPIVSEADAGNGMKTVHFAETQPLPSYLVAFAIGPWQTLELGRVGMKRTPLRIIVPRTRGADTSFASRAYPQLFGQLERWFGIAYPFDKLDQVAIPLTVGFAMENAGMITYGAPILLAKPDAATPRFRHGSASVGAHEMAHQWFGNMVTAAWWDDIWLNEAFATWFAEKMVDQWRPDYERGAGRIAERAQAISADLLGSARRIREPIVSRGDIFNAFDSITYQKGATVIGMFEGWIGEAPFRRGVRKYLESRRDGNATVDDFLGALGAGSKLPVAPAFSTFLDQNGVPQVEVRLQCGAGGAQLALSQHRLTPFGGLPGDDRRWQIPVCARYGAGSAGGATRKACTLLTEKTGTLPLPGKCPTFLVANAGGTGYYVPDYRDGLLERVGAGRQVLSPAEYASVLYDMQALLRAGSVTGVQALEWVRDAGASRDRHVVEAAIALADLVRDMLVGDAERPQFAAFARQVFGDRARALGYAPHAGESDDDQLLRRTVIRFVAPADRELAAEARRLALAWIADRKAVDPGMADTVLLIAGETGDAAMQDALLAEARTTKDSLDRRNLMVALFAFSDPALAKRGLGTMLDPAFDMRESLTALRISSQVTPARRDTHDFIMANLEVMAKLVSQDTPGGWAGFAGDLCSERDRAEVEAFWRGRFSGYVGGERTLTQALETIQLCTALRTKEQPAVAAFLKR